MTIAEASEQLTRLYVALGDNQLEMTDALSDEIQRLEDIVNPPIPWYVAEIEVKGCGCDHPKHCWDCAAIRGGCPEDV
jgi:hypothetical protein